MKHVMQEYNVVPLVIPNGLSADTLVPPKRAAAASLWVAERSQSSPGVQGLLHALEGVENIDILSLQSPLDADSRRVLLHGCHAVLANSGHEPFGLVGLETMAAGGVACTGCSGEDYAVPGRNALVLETTDPQEFLGLFGELRANPLQEYALRRAGRMTAKHYTWLQIMQRILLPRLRFLATFSYPAPILVASTLVTAELHRLE